MVIATFITDIPTLFVIGLAVAMLLNLRAGRRLTRTQYAALQKRMSRSIFAATALFIGLIEIPTFLDVPYAVWLMKTIPAADGMTGNEFMWHGYFRWPGRWICEMLSSESAACAAYDPPIGNPGNAWWWSVIGLCFLLQWLAAKLGQRVAGFVRLFRGDSDRPESD